jgi:hypothetical protein
MDAQSPKANTLIKSGGILSPADLIMGEGCVPMRETVEDR